MGINEVLLLVGGLALFLFGMNVMSGALEHLAGGQLRSLLGKMTSNPFKGFLLGFAVTAIVQSSSATTVMVVGFVNSGLMTLYQAVGIIIGANMGAAMTPLLLSISSVGGGISLDVVTLLSAGFAVVGVILYVFLKKSSRQTNLGLFLLGFAVLMFGMEMMSDSVSGLKDVPAFTQVLTLFHNPLMGILVGIVVTAAIQSSGASIGILQALTATGSIANGMVIPIIMGQNIGTCVSAMLASIGANKNAKRAAFIHLSYNIISTLIFGGLYTVFYYLLRGGILNLPAVSQFLASSTDAFGVAIIDIIYKVISTLALIWFPNLFVRLATFFVRESGKKQDEVVEMLDERLLATPSVAVQRANDICTTMAATSFESIKIALRVLRDQDLSQVSEIRKMEQQVDVYEDKLGSYLVQLSACQLTDRDAAEVTKMLHVLSDVERISDHAVNLAASAQEMQEKKLTFSGRAQEEFRVMSQALAEIIDLTAQALIYGDMEAALRVEPLEQVIDKLREIIKHNHIHRLQKSECTIEHGFVLSDLLTTLSRVSDHCSNIAGCLIEITHDSLDMHEYLSGVKKDNGRFNAYYASYSDKYQLKEV